MGMLRNMRPHPGVVNQVVQLGTLRYSVGMESERKDQRVPVMMSASEVRNLDAWRRAQQDLPSRGGAIRRLIEAGLRAEAAPAPKTTAPPLERTRGAGRKKAAAAKP
jgi:hypothetical protein